MASWFRACVAASKCGRAASGPFSPMPRTPAPRRSANTPPLPQPGDEIVVSRLDYYGMLDRLPIHKELLNTQFDSRCGVFVLNRRFRAGLLFHPLRLSPLRHRLRRTERIRSLPRAPDEIPYHGEKMKLAAVLLLAAHSVRAILGSHKPAIRVLRCAASAPSMRPDSVGQRQRRHVPDHQ